MNVNIRNLQPLFFIMGIIALASLIVSGCASTFTRETSTTKFSEGEKAISIARESNAAIIAPAALELATDKLAGAGKALENDDYETATRLSEQASVDADYARVKAISMKEKKATEMSRENINALRHEVERMPAE
ncbi:MAG: DUF4398 domain-containing protein [Pseudomonadota bacterium]